MFARSSRDCCSATTFAMVSDSSGASAEEAASAGTSAAPAAGTTSSFGGGVEEAAVAGTSAVLAARTVSATLRKGVDEAAVAGTPAVLAAKTVSAAVHNARKSEKQSFEGTPEPESMVADACAGALPRALEVSRAKLQLDTDKFRNNAPEATMPLSQMLHERKRWILSLS